MAARPESAISRNDVPEPFKDWAPFGRPNVRSAILGIYGTDSDSARALVEAPLTKKSAKKSTQPIKRTP